ncbi:hypothetical protein VXQ39_18130, partial [Acinetobacter baumannii]
KCLFLCVLLLKKYRAIARFIVAFAFAFQKDTSEASAIAFDFKFGLLIKEKLLNAFRSPENLY